eukprot:403371301
MQGMNGGKDLFNSQDGQAQVINSMKDMQISAQVKDQDLFTIEVCNCGSEQKAIYYCFDPKPDCQPDQIYFCDLCKINHLNHASISIMDFKNKYHRDVLKNFNTIEEVCQQAQIKFETYRSILKQCQIGRQFMNQNVNEQQQPHNIQKRRDLIQDFLKVTEIFTHAKEFREYADKMFQNNQVKELNALAVKFKDLSNELKEFQYIENLNDTMVWDCYQPIFESDYQFDLDEMESEADKHLYYKFKLTAMTAKVQRLQKVELEHQKLKQFVKIIADKLDMTQVMREMGL